MKVFLFKGDLTTLDVDAVVNAANGIGPWEVALHTPLKR